MPSFVSRCSRTPHQNSLLLCFFLMQVWIAGPAAACSSLGGISPEATAEHTGYTDSTLVTLLRKGVEHNFRGDLTAADAVWAQVREYAPDHPAGPFFEVSTLYWRQTFDAANDRYDAAIIAGVEETIRLADLRLTRNPADVEALFYRGQAKMNIARLEVVRGHYIKAGSAGEDGREDLERVLQLDPYFVDAKYQLGLYSYYAAKLPGVMKWLSFLWFIPKGDGPLGLKYMKEVHAEGDLMRHDAGSALLSIHTYLDPEPDLALEIATELRKRFPTSTLIHFQVIEALTTAKDGEAVIREALLLEQGKGAFFHDAGRRRMAMIWRARAELEMGRPEIAWAVLESFGEIKEEDPGWALPWVSLTRGRVLDVLGNRTEAITQYRVATQMKSPEGDPFAAALAKQHIKNPYQIESQQSEGISGVE